jgi:hypothetical protein
MIDPKDYWVSEEQIRATEAARVLKDGKNKPRPRKQRRASFLKVSVALAHKLRDDGANGEAWAMVMALTETWFTTGIYSQHPNPFSLSALDSQRWAFTRRQKSRALQFLTRIRLISVDRQDPENPLVTIAWEPRYQP